jgi:hypothetical protein
MPSPSLPSDAAWDAIGNRAQREFQRALLKLIERESRHYTHGAIIAPVYLAGVIACAEVARVGAAPGMVPAIEDMIIAFVRGAMRDAGRAINADGSPWSAPEPPA